MVESLVSKRVGVRLELIRKTLFDGPSLQVGLVTARPISDACGDVERQTSHVVVLPLHGVFSKHDSRTRHVLGTPSHALFVRADQPYRVGFPGAIGDRCLTLRFADDTAPEETATSQTALAPHALLPANIMILRNLLFRRLSGKHIDLFEAEDLGFYLLSLSLKTLRPRDDAPRGATLDRRKRAVQRVKEAVGSAPSDKWTVARLAEIAHLSPYHLCHVFRETVGATIYEYVLHERLSNTLDAVLDGVDDLTAVALNAGFASHSHFTARFHHFFGCTPVSLRRVASGRDVAEFRKIVTAHRSTLALD